jgi:hypothetical protein
MKTPKHNGAANDENSNSDMETGDSCTDTADEE